tara:strand:- start:1411 stop:2202 length:792 start_codon:yes stop_codon:yes gene_type:complete
MNDLAVRYSMSELEQMARVMSASRMFGFKNPEEAVSLMLMAQAEGKHPAKAAQEYHIIQGRPTLKADAMLARFQSAGGVVEWESMTDDMVSAYFSHPTSCPKPVLVDWTMERATTAKLTGKDNWTKYPRQMLKARVISEGVRMTFPGVTVGLYTPEEVMQFDDDKPEMLTAKVFCGSDVPHITKSDAIAEEIKEEKFNGKERGNHFELMAELTTCDTAKKAKTKVTKAYNKYAYTGSERDTIDAALIEHCERLKELEAESASS